MTPKIFFAVEQSWPEVQEHVQAQKSF